MEFPQDPLKPELSVESLIAQSRPDRSESASASKAPVEDFTGSLVPLQIRVPSDMRDSLRLLAIKTGESMSDIVIRCMTTPDVVQKAWVSTRKSA